MHIGIVKHGPVLNKPIQFFWTGQQIFFRRSLRRTLVHLISNAAFTEAKMEAYKSTDGLFRF